MADSPFGIVKDIIDIHSQRGQEEVLQRPQGGVKKKYRSLPSAGFLLAMAVSEQASRQADDEWANSGAGAKLSSKFASKGFVSSWASYGIDLSARTRVAPSASASTKIWKWQTLAGKDLENYLCDTVSIRNCLAHEGNISSFRPVSLYFGSKPRTVNLMMTEGLLQAVQDILFLLDRGESRDWKWQLPVRSKVGRMSRRISQDPHFPLP